MIQNTDQSPEPEEPGGAPPEPEGGSAGTSRAEPHDGRRRHESWAGRLMLFSQRLALVMKRARVEQGISLMRVSAMTGISRRAIRVMEKGDGSLPSLATLLGVADALGLSLVTIARQVEEGR